MKTLGQIKKELSGVVNSYDLYLSLDEGEAILDGVERLKRQDLFNARAVVVAIIEEAFDEQIADLDENIDRLVESMVAVITE